MKRIKQGLAGMMLCLAMTWPTGARAQGTVIQLRSNGLYDLAATPNIGIELQSKSGWAWQLDYLGAWWNSGTNNRYFSSYGLQTEIRRYLDHVGYGSPFLGQHVGWYGQLATYDFKLGRRGILCKDLDDSFGMGVSYGYCQRINKWLSVDFTIGCGVFVTHYDEYTQIEKTNRYQRMKSERKTFIGPTKLEVTLVWNLSHSNRPSYF